MSLETREGGEPAAGAASAHRRAAGCASCAARRTRSRSLQGLLGGRASERPARSALAEEIFAAELSPAEHAAGGARRCWSRRTARASARSTRRACCVRARRCSRAKSASSVTARLRACCSKQGEPRDALSELGEAFVRAPDDDELLAELEAHAEHTSSRRRWRTRWSAAAARDDGSRCAATGCAAARARRGCASARSRAQRARSRCTGACSSKSEAREPRSRRVARSTRCTSGGRRARTHRGAGAAGQARAGARQCARELARRAGEGGARRSAIRSARCTRIAAASRRPARPRGARRRWSRCTSSSARFEPLIEALRQRASHARRSTGGARLRPHRADLRRGAARSRRGARRRSASCTRWRPSWRRSSRSAGLLDRAAQREVSEARARVERARRRVPRLARRCRAGARVLRPRAGDRARPAEWRAQACTSCSPTKSVRGRAADLLAGAFATTDDVDGLLELLPHRLASASTRQRARAPAASGGAARGDASRRARCGVCARARGADRRAAATAAGISSCGGWPSSWAPGRSWP